MKKNIQKLVLSTNSTHPEPKEGKNPYVWVNKWVGKALDRKRQADIPRETSPIYKKKMVQMQVSFLSKMVVKRYHKA
ncbi:MAG: hypothetical protein MK212_14605 [Saprospiraceae bacterium]|nr:hypothetical protein [Saprospiraceae bacterium]